MTGESPRGLYRTIVADPSWPMPETGRATAADTDTCGKYVAKSGRVIDGTWWATRRGITTKLPYETMTLAEIAALAVPDRSTRCSRSATTSTVPLTGWLIALNSSAVRSTKWRASRMIDPDRAPRHATSSEMGSLPDNKEGRDEGRVCSAATTESRPVWTLHEIEDGVGNGVIHWYCSDACRSQETADYGEVDPIIVDGAPTDSRCETCGVEV